MNQATLLQLIQSWASPALDRAFEWVTRGLYSEDFFVAALPLFYWVVDRPFARTVTLAMLAQLWVQDTLKGLVGAPRPVVGVDVGRALAQDTATGAAFPSGHAQGPTVFWGLMAWRLRRRWFTWLAVALVLAVGLSRLYLGLHWPVDVAGGFAIGLLVLWLTVGPGPRWVALAAPWSLAAKLGAAAAVVGAAALTYRGETGPHLLGAWLGIWWGTLLEERYVGYDPRAPWPWQVGRVVFGLAVLFALRMGLKALLPPGGGAVFVRYLAIGLTAALALPLLYRHVPGAQRVGTSK